MNIPAEIAILKKEIRDLTKRVNQKSPFVTWGTIVGKLREQKDIAKNFRLKQDLLKNGVNIKTINGESILGSGDLTITGGAGAVEKRHEWVSPYSYCGVAPNGTLDSASTWEIKRIEVLLDGTTSIMSASSVAWDNRLTVIYS